MRNHLSGAHYQTNNFNGIRTDLVYTCIELPAASCTLHFRFELKANAMWSVGVLVLDNWTSRDVHCTTQHRGYLVATSIELRVVEKV